MKDATQSPAPAPPLAMLAELTHRSRETARACGDVGEGQGLIRRDDEARPGTGDRHDTRHRVRHGIRRHGVRDDRERDDADEHDDETAGAAQRGRARHRPSWRWMRSRSCAAGR